MAKENDAMRRATEKRAVDTLRVFGAETVSHAGSGHSGIALGAAPIMYSAYASMKVDPGCPSWFNRDRFVMSAGHGSASLYSTLMLMGFDISVQDLKTFRTLGSHLTGHPELNTKIGVDCSTGPLGQGVAMAVGIALAETRLAKMFNKGGLDIVDHYTFVMAGDGCLMEGVSYEACNLAGLWKLNKLIMLYDCNNVTLDGTKQSADAEDVRRRFEACGWRVLEVGEDSGVEGITYAIAQAKTSEDAPTIIIVNTIIGYGDKREGTNKAHGAVLTVLETIELRERFGLGGRPFDIATDVKKHFAALAFKNINNKKEWDNLINKYRKNYPNDYRELEKFWMGSGIGLDVVAENKSMSLRDAGGLMLNQIAKQSLRVYGGSADLSSTTKAFVEGAYFAAGVREFAMAAICNGLALHGFTPYCSTFLAFSDYCRPAIRMSAMMNLPVTYVFSHDGLGNAPDGPTHQGNEHVSSLRLIPNMTVLRPCDDVETAAVYKWVFENGRPVCIVLGRGSVPSFSGAKVEDIEKGGYVVSDCDGRCSAVLIGTGAEVVLCLEVQELLRKNGLGVCVVSMPSMELFDRQDAEYREDVLGGDIPKVAIEMGSGGLWYKYIGANGLVISFDEFGESGSDKAVSEKIGFSAESIMRKVWELVKK